ncbi:DUF1700 domain-containing protein [uncultured Holdemanella sp.]|uniref:DUF1700 domain-containing protein n=1 Tax=uncultured Holdemanella sp. TaxID=1763549 RepID=UPI0025CD62A7|nr:DUF1700 domain-containing protein [uncultured Holdemanella sp.]
MLKSEFLELLNQKLSLINDKEREDIILEYGTYIDDKISNGVSEEEAVAGFGDVDELAKEILSAYKINTDSMDPLSSKADKTIDKVYAKVEELFSKLGDFSMNQIFHVIFDAFVLVLILWIGKLIVVDVLCRLILSILFSFFVGYHMITEFMLGLCRLLYLCLAIYFFVKVMSKRIQRYRFNNQNVGVMDDIKETWNDNIKSNDLPPTPDRPLYHERKPHHFESDVLKVILVFAMIPVACILIGSGIGLVVMIYVSMMYATTSAGLYCMDIAFVLGSLAILLMLFRAWPKKVDTNA